MQFESQVLETHYIPSVQQPGKAVLLLVHGRGGKWTLMEWFSKRSRQDLDVDYLCVQAPHPEFVPEMKVPGFSWYVGANKDGLEDSRERLSRLVQELIDFGYSAKKIFWLGFSQGGVMGLDLGLRGGHQLGGIVCVSGFCLDYKSYPENFGPCALQQKFIATHGKRDEIVDFDRAKKSYEHLIESKVQLEFLEYDKPHSFDLKNEIPELTRRLSDWVKA